MYKQRMLQCNIEMPILSIHRKYKILVVISMIVSCLVAHGRLTEGIAQQPDDKLDAIGIKAISVIPREGCDISIKEQLSPTSVILSVKKAQQPWIVATLSNLSTDKETTIILDLPEGTDEKLWENIVPVITYADPTKLETYESFEKNTNTIPLSIVL